MTVPDKWYHKRQNGSLRFNVTGFQLDPMPRGIGIEEKQRAFCSHLTKSQLYQMIFPIKLSGLKKYEASDQVGTPLR